MTLADAKDILGADLRSYMQNQERMEREWEAKTPIRVMEALEQIQTREGLSKVLEDDFLCAPLADMLYNLEIAGREIGEGKPGKGCEVILNRLARIERSLVGFLAKGEEL